MRSITKHLRAVLTALTALTAFLCLSVPCFGSVVYDTMGATSSLGGTTMAITITVGAGSNRALIWIGSSQAATGDVFTGISGVSGVTWTKYGNAAGNGTMRGDVWCGAEPPTGSITATAALALTSTGAHGAFLYSYNGVDATTPCGGYVATLSGTQSVTVVSGDAAVSGQVDDNNNRSVTNCTTTEDVSTYGSYGISSAHCAASPSVFAWDGFGGTSMAQGISVLQSSGGGGGAAVCTRSLLGVGC